MFAKAADCDFRWICNGFEQSVRNPVHPADASHQTWARGSYWKDVPEKALIGIGSVGILGKAQK